MGYRPLPHLAPEPGRVAPAARSVRPLLCRFPACRETARTSTGFCSESHADRYADLKAEADRVR